MCTFKELSDRYMLFRARHEQHWLSGMVIVAVLMLIAGEGKAVGLRAPDAGFSYLVDSGQSLGNDPSWDAALGDVDNDGDLDAVTANGAGLVVDVPDGVWINDGEGIFSQVSGFGETFSLAVALGDLDGDGDLDAFMGTVGSDGSDAVWLNDGSGLFTGTDQNLVAGASGGVALGDLDGDGDLDGVVVDSWQEGNRVWINDGAAIFTDSGQVLDATESLDVALGDLDADGDLDIFIANGSTYAIGANRVWFNDGGGNFVDSGQNLGNSDSLAVALGDVNGDGHLDAFVANEQGSLGQANRVWLNNGKGFFTDSGQELGNGSSTDVDLADIDLDGDYDAVVANEFQPKEVWLNDGLGNFFIGQLLSSFGTQGLATGDVNQDNKPDIFFANNEGCFTICLGFPNEVWLNQVHRQHLPFVSGWTLASASDDGIIRLWKVERGATMQNLPGNLGGNHVP